MERALEQQIPSEGDDHPRELGIAEIQGEPAPRSGMGREGPRCSGEAQAGPSPSGKLWVPGTGVGLFSSSQG